MSAFTARLIKNLFCGVNGEKARFFTANRTRYFFVSACSKGIIQDKSLKKFPKPLRHNIDTNCGVVEIYWEDEVTSRHSSIFLRDCCLCSQCFNSDSKQRRIDTFKEIPLNIKPISIGITNSHVRFTWPDNHVTVFTHEFLLERRCNEYKDISQLKPTLWASLSDIPRFNLDSVLENEATRYAWFESFCEFGVALFTGAKKEKGELERVKKIFGGYFKSTHYG